MTGDTAELFYYQRAKHTIKIHEHPDKHLMCQVMDMEQKSAPSPRPKCARRRQTPACCVH